MSRANSNTYRQTFSLKRLCFAVCALLLVALMFTNLRSVNASSVAEQFETDGVLKPGLLVSTSEVSAGKVELATIQNSGYLLGVVTASESATQTFSKAGASTTVALSGVVTAYVTDVNGEIKKGSLIGPSWLEGVGMAVQAENVNKVIGVAQEDFNPTATTEFPDVETPSGRRAVKVGSVAIRLSAPPALHAPLQQSGVAGFTARLAGQQVSYARIFAAFSIFLVSLLVCAIFIRNAIKSSFTSLGRNPMASHSIYRGLLQVSLVAAAVILIGTAAAYAVIVV